MGSSCLGVPVRVLVELGRDHAVGRFDAGTLVGRAGLLVDRLVRGVFHLRVFGELTVLELCATITQS